jgi:hypothetical protein
VAEIPFDQFGFAILPVCLKPRFVHTMPYVEYKIDSGANCTTISHDELFKLGFDGQWIKGGRVLDKQARPTVASGHPVDDCYEIVLPEIRIGDYVGYNWPFITSLSASFRFLLGTDTMQFFNWTFDYEHGLCKFDLIPGKRRLLFNSQEQSIHALDELEKQ